MGKAKIGNCRYKRWPPAPVDDTYRDNSVYNYAPTGEKNRMEEVFSPN